MDIPFAYKNTTNSTHAPAEKPWVIPNHGTSTIETASVMTNISVVDHIRGGLSCFLVAEERGARAGVFDMGYLY
jgi:hypothetical protein